MYILGLNAFHGDSSACLFKNNELILSVEEERFRRIKHWAGFPAESINACLEEAGIKITDVDVITISKNPSANLLKKIKHTLLNHKKFSTLIDRLSQSQKVSSVKGLLAEYFRIKESDIKAKVHNIEHHRSHMASTFFVSPFQEAAILSVDGFGDFSSTMVGTGKGNKIDVSNSVIYPHSLGVCYTAFTQYLGFLKYGDEYKVMGLAPYGDPKYLDKMEKVIQLTNNGMFKLNDKYFKHNREGITMTWEEGYPDIAPIFTEEMVKTFGPARKKDEELTQHHKDIAASIQKMTEKAIFHLLNHLHKKTGLTDLCIAGGVAQNSVANGKIYENTPFKNVYIPPAATDAGTSIGSALYFYVQNQKNERPKPMFSADLGPAFIEEDIVSTLKADNISYEIMTDEQIREAVTDCLIEGGVVGWYKGRSEFGPRALGYRSILADPRRKDAKEILNKKIKKRESFRPFAPSILKEFVGEYFEIDHEVPFMEKVFKIKKEKHQVIPAVTHVDGTGRLQSVSRETNPKYYDMIHRFYEKTQVPIVLNTSFNENEPIVNSPAEALDCFLRTKMDMLVLENYVITRENIA